MKDNNRELARHVDGRVKIGFIPVFAFFKILPIYILILILLFNFFSPITLVFCIASAGGITFLFSEFKHGESGMSMLKDMFRYFKEGDIHFERSCVIRDEIKRITINEIDKKGRKNQKGY